MALAKKQIVIIGENTETEARACPNYLNWGTSNHHNLPPGHVIITRTTETAQVPCLTARAVGYGRC